MHIYKYPAEPSIHNITPKKTVTTFEYATVTKPTDCVTNN